MECLVEYRRRDQKTTPSDIVNQPFAIGDMPGADCYNGMFFFSIQQYSVTDMQ